MEWTMANETPNTMIEYQHLVQRIRAGGIPVGKDFDACRAVLDSAEDHETKFRALFTLLEGALSDPFFGIAETRDVVQVLKGLARKEIAVEQLL
jgi:hypothetical protein